MYIKMQSSRSILSVSVVNKIILRTVAVNSANVNPSEALKSWQEIPGPSSLPFIGQIHHFLPGRELSDVTKLQDMLCDKYGPIVRLDGLLGKPPLILLYDAESVATILRSENWMPIRPGFTALEYFRKTHSKTEEQLGKPTGLITDHGENWKQVRSMVNPVMLQPKTIKLYAAALEEVAQDMIERMRSIRDENNMLKGEFDIEMNLWSLESISVVALGGRLNCFNRDLAEDSPERRLIQCVHDIFQVSHELDFMPSLWRYFSTRNFRRGMKLYEEQENLTRYFIQKAINELKTQSNKSDDEKGILEKLLAINEDIAIIMASDMLFAGVDTAANTVTATLYLLARNPEKQEKLRKELNSGNEQTPYLKACLKESLRLSPVVAGNLRQATKEYNILGYTIPKDMQLVLAHQYLSSVESQYPRAKEFIPERWIDKESPIYHAKAHPFAYSPFGFGVRSCIGRRIAELEMHTFLAKVIQNFKVEWTGPPIKVKPSALNYLVGPFNFTFKDV